MRKGDIMPGRKWKRSKNGRKKRKKQSSGDVEGKEKRKKKANQIKRHK